MHQHSQLEHEEGGRRSLPVEKCGPLEKRRGFTRKGKTRSRAILETTGAEANGGRVRVVLIRSQTTDLREAVAARVAESTENRAKTKAGISGTQETKVAETEANGEITEWVSQKEVIE